LAALARGFSDRHFERGEGPGDEVDDRADPPPLTEQIVGSGNENGARGGVEEAWVGVKDKSNRDKMQQKSPTLVSFAAVFRVGAGERCVTILRTAA